MRFKTLYNIILVITYALFDLFDTATEKDLLDLIQEVIPLDLKTSEGYYLDTCPKLFEIYMETYPDKDKTTASKLTFNLIPDVCSIDIKSRMVLNCHRLSSDQVTDFVEYSKGNYYTQCNMEYYVNCEVGKNLLFLKKGIQISNNINGINYKTKLYYEDDDVIEDLIKFQDDGVVCHHEPTLLDFYKDGGQIGRRDVFNNIDENRSIFIGLDRLSGETAVATTGKDAIMEAVKRLPKDLTSNQQTSIFKHIIDLFWNVPNPINEMLRIEVVTDDYSRHVPDKSSLSVLYRVSKMKADDDWIKTKYNKRTGLSENSFRQGRKDEILMFTYKLFNQEKTQSVMKRFQIETDSQIKKKPRRSKSVNGVIYLKS